MENIIQIFTFFKYIDNIYTYIRVYISQRPRFRRYIKTHFFFPLDKLSFKISVTENTNLFQCFYHKQLTINTIS